MIKLTRNLAWAAAMDAANARMRKSGRKAWDLDDYNSAVATFDRLWPLAAELASKELAYQNRQIGSRAVYGPAKGILRGGQP